MNNKGQFSIIAAMFVAVILISSVMMTYSSIRYGSIQDEPHILSAIDETNLALKQVLGFTVGYYGSVLQVTGNSSYARTLADKYLKSGLENVANIRPEWGSSFNVVDLSLSNNWFTNASYSKGTLTVNYSLTGLGVSGVTYSASCRLDVQISPSSSSSQVRLTVLRDENQALNDLGRQNFKFYLYRYNNLTWEMVSPSSEPVAFSNGTYLVDVPLGINPYSYIIQVEDTRGIIVAASSFSHYTSTLVFNSTVVQGGDYVDNCNSTVDTSPDVGSHSNFAAQQAGPDSIYDTLTEDVAGTFTQDYYPDSYSPQGSTTLASGSLTDLQSDNGISMTFRSYPSAFSGTSTFGYSTKGSNPSDFGYIRGSRFTCTSSGLATNISAYLKFTSSSGSFGNTNTGSSGQSINDAIRGQRFTSPSSPTVAQSIAAYLDVSGLTWGYTSTASSKDSIEGNIRGSSFACSTSGTIATITAYIETTATYNMKAAIYNHATNNSVAETQERSVSSGTNWITFTFSTPPSVTADNVYVLVVWSQSRSGESAYLRYHSGSSNQGHSQSQGYGGSFPSTASFGHNNQEYCIYASYTPQNHNVKAAIYDSSSNLVATTQEAIVSADGWTTLNFPSPPTLAASTNYVLVVWAQSGGSVNLEYSSSSGDNGRYVTGQTYGNWPSSLSFSTDNYQYCVYCNYQTAFNAKAAIYSGIGSTLIASTEEKTLTTVDSWVTFNFPSPPTLAASTQYVLVAWASDTDDVDIYYDTGSAEYFRQSATYPTWPSSVADQSSTRRYSINCTYTVASEYTCEVEFSGLSNTDNWNSLLWTIDLSATADASTTFQLYNYAADAYPTSGDGFMTATVGAGGVTQEQNIPSNPTDFRDDLGRWNLKLRAVRSASSSFDMNIDFTRYRSAVNSYGLDLEEQWTSVDCTDPVLCIKTGALGSENMAVDAWYDDLWHTLSPRLAAGWNNVSVASYVDSPTFTIRFRANNGLVQNNWQIDAVLLRPESDLSLFRSLQDEVAVVELLQNGTMRWLGQHLQNTTEAIPIPPVSVKAIHVNQTIEGVDQEVPFQIEDWASEYSVPLGLTNNATVFGNRQMIVFSMNTSVSKFTVWWNGSDEAIQTPLAFTNRFFTDNPSGGTLRNGRLTLGFGGNFIVTSTVGNATCNASFMRINAKDPQYGSNLAYVIYNGTVRDIITQEAEWNNTGIPDCPNVYSQIVMTLPANTGYYTYQLRLMFLFLGSAQSRTITDLCPIRLSSSFSQLQTENGTSHNIPLVVNGSGLFNSTQTWVHHWSQFISDTGTKGAGIMFTDESNQMLYVFDQMNPPTVRGAFKANSTASTIELLPVTLNQVAFQTPFDVTWHGAVATFDGTNPIYTEVGTITGLWIFAELPPTITVNTDN